MSNMKPIFTSRFGLGLLGVLPLICGGVAGCKNTDPEVHGEVFPADDRVNPVTRFSDVQKASGARNDATLYASHFDGGKLNSLGEAKLDLMMRDDAMVSPMMVYVSGAGDMNDARKASITTYLKDHGLKDEQVRIAEGANPGTFSPAAPSLARMSKTESGATETAGAGAGAAGGASAPAAMTK
jgi:hypothetical protein